VGDDSNTEPHQKDCLFTGWEVVTPCSNHVWWSGKPFHVVIECPTRILLDYFLSFSTQNDKIQRRHNLPMFQLPIIHTHTCSEGESLWNCRLPMKMSMSDYIPSPTMSCFHQNNLTFLLEHYSERTCGCRGAINDGEGSASSAFG
jgi:hypothetical protein